MSTPRGLAILGSTGSIGRSTLEVVALHPEWFRVAVLGAHSSWQVIVEQARVFSPDLVVLGDPAAAAQARALLSDCGSPSRVECGPEALAEAVAGANVDIVMAAIVGAAGLPSTLAAVRASKRVLLANKEALVMAGPLLMEEVRRAGAEIIPIDSEHNAIFQCMPAGYLPGDIARGVVRVILTASGGPFRCAELGSLNNVTPDEACAHPKWKMGRKISVDSATLMNKGLEIIEAHHLFRLPSEQIDVVIHPQSVIHGLVTYHDGSVLAHLGAPDMRTPIAYALGWPGRTAVPMQRLDLAAVGQLTFAPPDPQRFPALRLAREALVQGGGTPTVLNAANETAVGAFIEGRIGFLDIAATVEETLTAFPVGPLGSLDDVHHIDAEARALAAELAAHRARNHSAAQMERP